MAEDDCSCPSLTYLRQTLSAIAIAKAACVTREILILKYKAEVG